MERQQRKMNGSPLRRSTIGTVRITDVYPEAEPAKFPIDSLVYLVESGFQAIVLEASRTSDNAPWVYTLNVRDLGDLYIVHRREELLRAERGQCNEN